MHNTENSNLEYTTFPYSEFRIFQYVMDSYMVLKTGNFFEIIGIEKLYA
jgi:hypothetical protein